MVLSQAIAKHLGLLKVGFIFNQSAAASQNEYIMSNEEICQICEIQEEIGEHCVSAVFVQEAVDGQVRGALPLVRSGFFFGRYADRSFRKVFTFVLRNHVYWIKGYPKTSSCVGWDHICQHITFDMLKRTVCRLVLSFPGENQNAASQMWWPFGCNQLTIVDNAGSGVDWHGYCHEQCVSVSSWPHWKVGISW